MMNAQNLLKTKKITHHASCMNEMHMKDIFQGNATGFTTKMSPSKNMY